MPLDEQLVEIFKALFPAGDGGVGRDGLFVGDFGGLLYAPRNGSRPAPPPV